MRLWQSICFVCLIVPFGLAQAQEPKGKDNIKVPGKAVEEIPAPDMVAPMFGVPPGTPGTPGGPGYYWGGPNNIPWDSNLVTNDSQRVGPYGQPAWTTQRPFSTSRAYVLPPGTMEFEQWYRPRWKRDGTREDRILEEVTFGLPCRFQLDIYGRWNIEPNENNDYQANWEGIMLELRWAVADWDVIPLNPTFYIEWIQRDNGNDIPDKYEAKLLLADSFLNDKVFWAGNFILEHEVSGAHELELGYSQAFATTIIERKLMAGVEMWYRSANEQGARSDHSWEFLIGPTMQWRPTNRTFLNITPLFGTTEDAPKVEMYVIFGIQFGTRAGPDFGGITPVALGQ